MEFGRHEATIKENRIQAAQTGTVSVGLLCDVDGEAIAVSIWLSEKSLNMAYKQLQKCGFDVEKEPLEILDSDPAHLAGRKVLIDVDEEEYQGKLRTRAQIVMGDVTKATIRSLQAKLRAVRTTKAPIVPKREEEPPPPDDTDIPF